MSFCILKSRFELIPCLLIYYYFRLEDEMKEPLPLQLEPSILSRDILCTFPTVGTVLRMSINQGDKKLSLHYFKPNRWVKLTKVKCEVRSALWMAVLMPYSKICYLRDDDDIVIDRLRLLEFIHFCYIYMLYDIFVCLI